MTENGSRAASSTDSIRRLNSLLRGELSAVDTYEMAIEQLSGDEDATGRILNQLQNVQEEHSQAVEALRDRILELGGDPSESSGAWGTWSEIVQGTMNLIGDRSALKGLRDGEEHGLKDYRAALDGLDATSRRMVSDALLPAQERHLSLLDELIGAAKI